MSFLDIPLLSTAISIVIAWALFSVLCGLAHEIFANLQGERGRFMKKHLFRHFNDIQNGVNWGSLMYDQSNISMFNKTSEKPAGELPARELATALIASIRAAGRRKLQKGPEVTGDQQAQLDSFRQSLEQLKPSDVVNLMKRFYRMHGCVQVNSRRELLNTSCICNL